MSLFGSALGGIGQAAGQLADNYIKQDTQAALVQQQAAIQRDRDQFVSDLRLKSEKDIAAFKNSPDQVAADVSREGAIAKAKADATPRELAPGQKMYRGDGTEIAANSNETAAQIQERLYREGLKGAGAAAAAADARAASAQRIADQKAAAADRKQREAQFFTLTDKNVTGDDGKKDMPKYQAVSALGRKELEAGKSPEEAFGNASMLYQHAQQLATEIAPTDFHLFSKNTPQPEQVAKLTQKIIGNINAGMSPDKVFDPKTYSAGGDAAAPSPSSALPPARSILERTGAIGGDEPAIPPAPPEMLLNPIRPNPAYAEWMRQYGAASSAAKQTQAVQGRSLLDQMNQRLHGDTGRRYPAGAM